MTAERDIGLARRAVACTRWRWMAGMLDMDGCRVVETARAGLRHADPGDLVGDMIGCGPTSEHDLPDLCDAPTRGAILELVREAWRVHWRHKPGAVFPEVVIERVSGGWQWRLMSYCHDGDGRDSVALTLLGLIVRSEREALVLALESAPLPRQAAEVGR